MNTTYEFVIYFSSIDEATSVYKTIQQLYPTSNISHEETRKGFTYELPKKLINDMKVLLGLNKNDVSLEDIRDYLNENISPNYILRFYCKQ